MRKTASIFFILILCLISSLQATDSENATLTAIKGVSVGHYTDEKSMRGCTVIKFPANGAVAGVDVRGAAPGTCETDLLAPENLVDRINGLLLTGGSAFGLHSAAGVMQRLEEEGCGLDVGSVKVPIVPAAAVFDLAVGDPKVRPDAKWGYIACKNASTAPVKQGNAGAGTGATVGKSFGMEKAMKGGVGSYAIRIDGGVIVAAIAVVNAMGDVVDPMTGKIIAGARGSEKGTFIDTEAMLIGNRKMSMGPGLNTTIGVVAVNAPYTKTQLTKIAQMSHDGMARAIRPVHTMYDGDTIFAVSVADPDVKVAPDMNVIGAAAVQAFSMAVVEAVKNARGVEGIPSYSEWKK